LSKTDSHLRLSGAFSVQAIMPKHDRLSSKLVLRKTRLNYQPVGLLSTGCAHRKFTAFAHWAAALTGDKATTKTRNGSHLPVDL
jgi:hypothetical protein